MKKFHYTHIIFVSTNNKNKIDISRILEEILGTEPSVFASTGLFFIFIFILHIFSIFSKLKTVHRVDELMVHDDAIYVCLFYFFQSTFENVYTVYAVIISSLLRRIK